MKRYLMTVMAAVALGGLFVGCSKDVDLNDGNTTEFNIVKNYEDAFVTRFGQPHENQTWGFGDSSAATRGTRTQNSPSCPDITQPYDEAWVTEYLTTAKEPNSQNIVDNYDDTKYHEAVAPTWVKTGDRYYVEPTEGHWVIDVAAEITWPTLGSYGWGTIPQTIINNQDGYWSNGVYNTISDSDKQWFETNCRPLINYSITDWNDFDQKNNLALLVISLSQKCQDTGRTDWFYIWSPYVAGSKTEEQKHWEEGTEGYWVEEQGYWQGGSEAYWEYDETYVTNFMITGRYDGQIPVAASEGSQSPGCERTIVVTGRWNITEDQRIGSLGKIIIADGGTVNVASGKTLNMVNQAQLVVLPGGTLTGKGKVEVNNGNESGRENYNGGTVSVATFNNNFGKFYNYGDFLVDEYQGGAKESNFYNHHLVKIGHFAGTGSTANARIFNECQFYVINNARIRNYEGVGGSALIVGGELMFSSSEDETSTPTYVGLAEGALVKCNTLYNNGTSWTGPTSGYAALEIDSQIDYLNWQQDAPETGGYFENNIYVKCGTWDNVPDGNGYHQTDASDAYNHSLSIADYKFWKTVANCRGNGGVKKVKDSNNELLPASEDFVLGSAGCTPGFKGDVVEDTPVVSDEIICRIIVEDLTVGENSDFDFNDVVFDVCKNGDLIIRAIGGELPLYIYDKDDDHEVHKKCIGSLPGDTNKGKLSYTYMRNTGWETGTGSSTAINYKAELGVIKTGRTFSSLDQARSIGVWVKKASNPEPIELKAPVGKVASKICVDTDFEWCSERQDIDKKFRKNDGTKLFQQYVRGIYPYDNDDWTSERKTWYQFRGE